jgi:hypothetical protein
MVNSQLKYHCETDAAASLSPIIERSLGADTPATI